MSDQILPHQRKPSQQVMRVSRYDEVSSLLIAAIIMVGFFVLLMFMIWLTTVLSFRNVYVPPELLQYGGGVDTPEGYEQDLEEPGLEELPEVEEPALESTLEAVTDLVSTQVASLNSIDSAAAAGHGSGAGDKRQKGPGGEGDPNIVPPWERWEIRFNTGGLKTYAKQLDAFGIELAALGGSDTVYYVKNMSKGSVTRESQAEDDRLWFTWREGKMATYDRQLLVQAGVKVSSARIVLQFYPKETEMRMLELEVAAAQEKGHTNPREFLKTVFGVRPKGASFEFYIVEQEFRDAPG